jgi:hypothetical protein
MEFKQIHRTENTKRKLRRGKPKIRNGFSRFKFSGDVANFHMKCFTISPADVTTKKNSQRKSQFRKFFFISRLKIVIPKTLHHKSVNKVRFNQFLKVANEMMEVEKREIRIKRHEKSTLKIRRPAKPSSISFNNVSKFFLPEKRGRRNVRIPHFLLGGNISDPLNLNSLNCEVNMRNCRKKPK